MANEVNSGKIIMTIARSDIVDDETPGFYHCTNRCVRRTFLCGLDEVTGVDYSHRKEWLEQRLLALCDIFSVDLFAFAVMSNHYHVVIYLDPKAPLNWSDSEVAERWLNAYSGRLEQPENAQQRELKKQSIVADKKKLKTYRQRLGSLSWFMSRLNEPLAKKSNLEDYCTGAFWEGRYTSQALLDEGAIFSCMCYVDLNPVRANIVKKLEESKHTSVKKRLDDLKQKEPVDVQAYLDASVTAISKQIKSKTLPMSLQAYIDLVEWTGQSMAYEHKAAMPANIRSSLESLNLQQNHWLKQMENFKDNFCHIVGPVEQIREKAKALKQRCMKGITAAQLLYQKSG